MKILILADIHSNWEALKKVFKYISEKHIEIDEYYILGDIIGYGPFPNECINLISKLPRCKILFGNHEMAVLNKLSTQHFNSYAKEAIIWTKSKLHKENIQFLRTLLVRDQTEYDSINYLFVHGSPQDEIREYITNRTIAKMNFNKLNADVCFFGHTHVSIFFLKDQDVVISNFLHDGMKIKIDKRYQYLINIGSVGQPRDGDSRLSFGILDTIKRTVLIKRLKYRYKNTQKAVIKAGLPGSLATRLAYGH